MSSSKDNMFERHKALQYPPNSKQALWRYFPYERLLDLLKSEELFLTHVPAFTDGLEGSLTTRTKDHLSEWFKRMNKSDETTAREEVRKYEEHQKQFYANCWHMNNYESYLMWKAYAERGFAVKTTFERVQASFEKSSIALTGGVINYVDFARDQTQVGNVFHLVMTKDFPYVDEREFRLLLWKTDPRNIALEFSASGIRVAVDIKMLIERVFVNPLNESVPGDLMQLLEQHNIPIDRSNLQHR